MNGSGRQIFKDLYAGEANKRSELLCTRADKFNPSEIPSSKQTFQPAQPSSDGMQGTLYNHIMSTIKSTRSPEIEKNNKGRAGKKIGGDQTVEESPTSLSSRTALLGCGVLFCCMHEEWLRAPSSFHFLPSVFALVLPFAISTHPSGLFLTFTSLWKEKEDRERGGERKKKIRRPLDLHVCPPSHQSAPSLSLSLSLSWLDRCASEGVFALDLLEVHELLDADDNAHREHVQTNDFIQPTGAGEREHTKKHVEQPSAPRDGQKPGPDLQVFP
mmetsp:Transcript_29173/g.57201  ORF Transcript_29173/g.57201 Transcript_29173/m.57201 type:complete len:272 (-) Transcript_29173:510-1325(-)